MPDIRKEIEAWLAELCKQKRIRDYRIIQLDDGSADIELVQYPIIDKIKIDSVKYKKELAAIVDACDAG